MHLDPLTLVARLTDEVVVDSKVRAALAALLPQTELAEAAATLAGLELRTGLQGEAALRRQWIRPAVTLSPPGAPRHPVSAEDLDLAARIASPDLVLDQVVREQLVDHLSRSPLGPAIWQIREIEWKMTAPPLPGGPYLGNAALTQWRAAGELVDELLARPDPAAAASDPKYREPLVVHVLIDRDHARRGSKPSESVILAKLAATVARLIGDRPGDWWRYRGLVALALASLANAYRIVGASYLATQALEAVEAYLGGEANPLIRGQCLEQVASTLAHQYRFGEARRAVSMAIAAFRHVGDQHTVAKLLMLNSFIDNLAGEINLETLRRLEVADRLADPWREPNLPQMLLLNRARYQAELGLVAEAEATWSRSVPFENPIFELRRQAIRGAIELAAGRWPAAVATLSETAAGLARLGHRDAAVCELLAVVARIRSGARRQAVEALRPLARLFADSQVLTLANLATEILKGLAREEVQEDLVRLLARHAENAPALTHTGRIQARIAEESS